MIELVKTIVDDKRQLVGFIVRGTDRELGGVGNDVIEKSLGIQTLLQNNFSNRQISIIKHQLYTKKGFKFNQLPMVVTKGDGTFINISNEINITKQFLMDNKRIGYEVTFADGSRLNVRYDNVVSLTSWFRPGNFVIRQLENGKKFISGRGIRLDELPTVDLGKKSKAKRAEPADGKSNKPVTGALEAGFDVLNVYEVISELDAYIVNLPNSEYERTSGTHTQLNNFTPFGIGDIASSNLEFTGTKLNVNAKFKKLGFVKVDVNGVPMPITTYTFSTKNIFFDGKNHMKKFGIVVDAADEGKLVDSLGKSLALTKITNEKMIKSFGQLLGKEQIAVYTVDTQNIDLMSKENVQKYKSKATAKNIEKLCKDNTMFTLASRYLDAEIRAIKKEHAKELSSSSNVSNLVAMYKEDTLREIQSAGIDIFSGAYRAPKEDTTVVGSEKDAKHVDVEIEYELATHKIDSKMTGTSIIKALETNEAGKINEETFEFIKKLRDKLDTAKTPEARLNLAVTSNGIVKSKLNKVRRSFWLINTAMYIEGDGKKLFVSRANEWEPVLKTRVKTALVWSNKNNPDLIVKIKGATI